MTVRIDHATTTGTFSLDGRTLEVENNVWVLGDNSECVVVDAPHDTQAILALVGNRRVTAILLTHGHDDHIGAVGALWDETGAPIHLHPADRLLWDLVYPGVGPDVDLHDGRRITVAGIDLHVLHTPGHSRGSVCFHVPDLGVLFAGDTITESGPGPTGGSFSDSVSIVGSIQRRLIPLPPETVIHTGHGRSSTLEKVAPHISSEAH
ncbi:MBL fold metallo-hydrolase [Phytoactinopolyspora limicola]|uniref:MBL fold metallo-hydrolase n=1 Tax=Phytoactinopolyspora limicola TaxID=2715536 RepID=UPI001407AE18|nr:MBL fold metallo-hydrolase [Phytoactinopolyspora limicola]